MPISDEDKALFHATMKDVKPLHTKVQRISPPPMATAPVRRPKEPVAIQRSEYYLSNYYSTIVCPTTTLSYCNAGMPRKRLKELKNGEIRWETRLDLHGLRPDAARDALCQFIDKHHQSGYRCLLIIHGKGGRLDEEPVLKNHVNHWLQQLPQVLAFHSAQARDGGTGALYVLLKRTKESI